MSTPRQVLQGLLSSYETAKSQLSTCEGLLAKANDQSQLILETDLVDEQINDKLWLAEKQKSIYTTKVESCKTNIARTLKELEQSINAAITEHNTNVRNAYLERSEVIEVRTLTVAQVPRELVNQQDLDNLLSHSKPLRDIQLFEMPAFTPRYEERWESAGDTLVTMNDGGREVKVSIGQDQHPVGHQVYDSGHTLSVARAVLVNIGGLERERQKKI